MARNSAWSRHMMGVMILVNSDAYHYYEYGCQYARDAELLMDASSLCGFNVSGFTDHSLENSTASPITTDEAGNIPKSTGPQPTLFFALGHALELLLKSFLICKDYSEMACRRDIGHNLNKALKEAKSKGLVISSENLIHKFSDAHYKLSYRYPKEPNLEFVPADSLLIAVKELISKIKSELEID